MYDFIDIGSSKGGSVRHCINHYGPNGYGIDVDERKVKIAQAAGYDVRHMDIFDIEDRAKVVTILHTIEHLPSRKYAQRLINKAVEIGERVIISYPWFGSDEYLLDMGYRMFWSYWRGHTLHLSRLELRNILEETGCSYMIEPWGPIESTLDKAIVPLDAPVDVLGYEPNMGKKENIRLKGVFREVRAEIW